MIKLPLKYVTLLAKAVAEETMNYVRCGQGYQGKHNFGL